MADRPYKARADLIPKLAVGPELRAALREVAEKAKETAEGLAQDFRVTGEYAGSFQVSDDTIDWTGQYPGRRAAGVLTNTASYAAAVEWGYKGRSQAESSSAHRVLGRTLDSLGE